MSRVTAPEVANYILDHMKERDWAWFPTQAIINHLVSAHGWPANQRNKIRTLLGHMAECELITKQGTGRMQWRMRAFEWDRSAPIRNPRVWSATYTGPRVVKEYAGAHTPSTNGDSKDEHMATMTTELDEDRVREIAVDTARTIIDDTVDQAVSAAMSAATERAIENVKAELIKRGVVKQELHVKVGELPGVKIEGKLHKSFERCVRLAAARRNVMLIGPAGCGKTHLVEQVAKSLGLEFGHVSCSAGMSEAQITGRMMPRNKGNFEYVRSEFVRFYEEGGVWLWDELDAADSNVLIVVNAALANGKMAVPNRPENPVALKHPDFVCFAAANTYGTGADRMYVGRNQLDESTLDRFRIGQIAMDYDEDVEAMLCPDEMLRSLLQGYRRKANDARLRRLVSMRFLRDAYIMLQAGDSFQDIEAALFAGWGQDEKAKVGYYR
jgi:hypothetical protein